MLDHIELMNIAILSSIQSVSVILHWILPLFLPLSLSVLAIPIRACHRHALYVTIIVRHYCPSLLSVTIVRHYHRLVCHYHYLSLSSHSLSACRVPGIIWPVSGSSAAALLWILCCGAVILWYCLRYFAQCLGYSCPLPGLRFFLETYNSPMAFSCASQERPPAGPVTCSLLFSNGTVGTPWGLQVLGALPVRRFAG
jgi:hypothetical protein